MLGLAYGSQADGRGPLVENHWCGR